MLTLREIYRDGRFFIAKDLPTKTGDQGLIESGAVRNLKRDRRPFPAYSLYESTRTQADLKVYRSG